MNRTLARCTRWTLRQRSCFIVSLGGFGRAKHFVENEVGRLQVKHHLFGRKRQAGTGRIEPAFRGIVGQHGLEIHVDTEQITDGIFVWLIRLQLGGDRFSHLFDAAWCEAFPDLNDFTLAIDQ